MNDDQIPELILRASAYLDGDLDADEMVRAEADPALMAEVEQLRALQAELHDVTPPSRASRERAIAAALAEFDQLHLADTPLATAPAARRSEVVELRRRPSSVRWLTAAAAVVGVLAIGAAVLQSGGGDNDTAGIAERDAESASGDAERITAFESDVAGEMQAPAKESDQASGGAEMTAADSPIAESATASATASESASVMATDTDNGGSVSDPVIAVTPTTPTTPVDLEAPVTEQSLWAVGQALLIQYRDGSLGITPETRCDLGGFAILAEKQFEQEGTLRRVIIAADPVTGETGAFDPDSCLDLAIVAGP